MSPVLGQQLVSFHLIETFNNNKLITWSYPSISNNVREVLLGNCFLKPEPQEIAYYRCANNEWVYVWESFMELKTYAFALVTKEFNPNKFQEFGKVFLQAYEENFNPVDLVKIYLEGFASGSYYVKENGNKIKRDLASFKKNYYVQDVVKMFGVESVLIYNALLLKKKVFVYHSNLTFLQKILLGITNLIDYKFRDPKEYLYPLVKNLQSELKGKAFFVAGIKDKTANLRNDSYDIFVNMHSQSINVSPSSKEIFAMTKIHKEIGKILVQHCENEECDDRKLVEHLNKKTDEILVNLKSLATVQSGSKSMITLEELRLRKLTVIMENFLFNLAISENIMML